MTNDKVEEWRNLNSELREAQARIAELFKPHLELGSAIRAQLGEITAAQKAITESITAFSRENRLGEALRQLQQQQEEFSKKYRLGEVAVKLQQQQEEFSKKYRIGEMVQQIRDQQEEFSKTYKLDELNGIMESHARMFQSFEWKVEFPKVEFEFGNVFSTLRDQIAEIASGYNAKFKIPFEVGDSLAKALRELPDNVRVSLVVLGKHGWFMDDAMTYSEIFQWAKALRDGNAQEVDDALCQHFESRLEAIAEKVTRLVAPLPRSDVIEAFEDHRKGSYRKAIVMILLTADGLCEKATKYSYFRRIPIPNTKKQNQPATAKYVEQFQGDSFRSAALEPLKHVLPLNKSGDERVPEEASQLNRHVIMHGEHADYGTRINSLRAISFLNYILDNLVEDAEITT